jgi:protein-L-isoaspartate O-methyltransferase
LFLHGKSTKAEADFQKEREETIERLIGCNLLRSSSIVEGMRKVSREEFLPKVYVHYAYLEAPFPIPGDRMQTMWCPQSYDGTILVREDDSMGYQMKAPHTKVS